MPRLILLFVVLVASAVAATSTPAPLHVGHAAGMNVTSAKLSAFRPSGLPPVCVATTQTLTASADTWVNENSTGTNYGGATTMTVMGRTSRNARALVRFTLPTAPSGCTLSGAQLRLYAGSVTTGRTLSAYRAAASWTETGVTWATAPATTGTAVDTTVAAVGWLEWAVAAHVQAQYSGTNTGFIVRDFSETGNGNTAQTIDTREGTNKPQLVLQWAP